MTDPPTFDYCPTGYPQTMSDAMTAVMHDRLDAGDTAGAIRDAIADVQVRELRSNDGFREALRAAFASSGVDLVSPTMSSLDPDLPAREGVRRDVARWHARFDAVPWLEPATGPDEARAIAERGHVGVVPNVQDLDAATDGDVDELDVLYNEGVRIAQLTYNAQNRLGAGCTERGDGGLSNLGVAFVERLNDLGAVIDLSHCGEATTRDAIEASADPVACTHTFCRALSDHDRGKTDGELRALADADGYLGVLALPFFVAAGEESATFDRFLDHVDHAVGVLGVDRVGIGTDWGSFTEDLPAPLRPGLKEAFLGKGFREEHGLEMGQGYDEMRTYADWGAIPAGLRDRGYTDREVAGLTGGNVLDLWDRAVH